MGHAERVPRAPSPPIFEPAHEPLHTYYKYRPLQNQKQIMSDTHAAVGLPATEAYVRLHLLNGGSMTAEYHKLHAGDAAEEFRLYNWAFFVQHTAQGRNVIWDVGMSSVSATLAPYCMHVF